jgi:NAD(P)H-flavin reductase
MYLVLGIMVLEYFVRLGSVFLYNCSLTQRRWTTLSIEALPEEATRLRITVPQSWIIRPGSHIYLYVPRLAFWSSHPFSVAWSESEVTTPFTSDKYLSTNSLTEPELISTTLFCVIRARTGMTKALYHAASHPHHTKRLWCAIEGPYNSYYSLDSYGTVVFFAAGAGITHTLLFIRKILAGYEAGTVAAQKILLVWCIRHFNAVEWIRSWLEDLSEMPGYCEVFRVQLYVSGTTTPILPAGLLAGVDVRLQRCMPQDVIHEEALGQIGTMAVVACGPRGFAGSVREALIQQVEIGSIDFWEESAC